MTPPGPGVALTLVNLGTFSWYWVLSVIMIMSQLSVEQVSIAKILSPRERQTLSTSCKAATTTQGMTHEIHPLGNEEFTGLIYRV